MIAGSAYLTALLIIHLLSPQLRPVDDVERIPATIFSVDSLIGFGFVGLVLGSFVGWCAGLLSRVAGQTLFKYMMLSGAIGIIIGIITSPLLRQRATQETRT